MHIWIERSAWTSVRSDGAKVGKFPNESGGMSWWAYPPGWSRRGPLAPLYFGPFDTIEEAKASLSDLLPFPATG